ARHLARGRVRARARPARGRPPRPDARPLRPGAGVDQPRRAALRARQGALPRQRVPRRGRSRGAGGAGRPWRARDRAGRPGHAAHGRAGRLAGLGMSPTASLVLTLLWGGFVAADTAAFLQLLLSQPLVAATITGLAWGNVPLGCEVGALLQLFALGV